MNLPPNRAKTNHVWHVTHRRFRSQEWYVLAKDAEEAKCVVLSENGRLKHEDLTAEEARP